MTSRHPAFVIVQDIRLYLGRIYPVMKSSSIGVLYCEGVNVNQALMNNSLATISTEFCDVSEVWTCNILLTCPNCGFHIRHMFFRII
jgi:hypothetical protein